MLYTSESVLMKKQTPLHPEWLDDVKCTFFIVVNNNRIKRLPFGVSLGIRLIVTQWECELLIVGHNVACNFI